MQGSPYYGNYQQPPAGNYQQPLIPPSAPQLQRGARLPQPLFSTILVLVSLALIIGSLAWLQWATQRSLTLGYPTPQVSIAPLASNAIQTRSTIQFLAHASGRDLTYSWDFGDQTPTAEGLSVAHTYQSNGSFTATVTVSDPLGHTNSTSTSVTVTPPPPTASFTYSIGYYGYVSFDASGSSADPSTSIATYSWNFGDGTTDTQNGYQDSHTYTSTGTYTVTLNVFDATNQESQQYQQPVVIQ